MKSVLDARKDYEQREFLKLRPFDRIKAMHCVMVELLALRAEAEGVSEYEIYRRYLRDNPRHYQSPAD